MKGENLCPVALYQGARCEMPKGHEGPHVFPDPPENVCGKRHNNSIARCELPAGHEKQEALHRQRNLGARNKPLAQQSQKQAEREAYLRGVKAGFLYLFGRFDEVGPHCENCGTRGNTNTLDLDHIIPRSRSGHDHPSNLQLLCRPCHTAKHGELIWDAHE